MEDLDVLNLDHLKEDSMFQTEEDDALWGQEDRHLPIKQQIEPHREEHLESSLLQRVNMNDERRESLELFAQLSQCILLLRFVTVFLEDDD